MSPIYEKLLMRRAGVRHSDGDPRSRTTHRLMRRRSSSVTLGESMSPWNTTGRPVWCERCFMGHFTVSCSATLQLGHVSHAVLSIRDGQLGHVRGMLERTKRSSYV